MNLMACNSHSTKICICNLQNIGCVGMATSFFSNVTGHYNIWFSIKWWACCPSTPRRRWVILFIISGGPFAHGSSSPRSLSLLCHIMLMIHLARLLVLPPAPPIGATCVLPLLSINTSVISRAPIALPGYHLRVLFTGETRSARWLMPSVPMTFKASSSTSSGSAWALS